MNIQLQKLQRENLTSLVYDGIKDALIKGRFLPGEKIGIRKMAEEMGTSPTPVREALLQLVSSHALEMKPAHSITVPALTKDLYLEIRAIRIILEGMAAERAAHQINDAGIKRLSDIDESMTQAKNSGDYKKALEWNQTFHFELCKAAKMPLLLALIEILWLRIGPSPNLIYPPAAPEPDEDHCHIRILEALTSKDAAGARSAIEKDLIDGGAQLLDYLQKHEQKSLFLDEH